MCAGGERSLSGLSSKKKKTPWETFWMSLCDYTISVFVCVCVCVEGGQDNGKGTGDLKGK